MKIVVCIKQVPDTAHLKFDSANRLLQDGMEYMMNPFCEYAVETAIRLKEANEGSTVTALSMGSMQAKEALKRAIAMGCDDAYLLSDDAFNGADAWVTAYTLSQAIKKLVSDVDLVILGQLATDDMSGMTGPALAEFMGLPSLTFVKKADMKDPQTLLVHRETERGVEIYEIALPGVISTMKCDYEPRIPSIKGVMKANRTEIPVMDLAALGLTVEQVGQKGAHTQVLNTWRKPKKEGGIKVEGSDPQVAVNQLLDYLKTQKVL